jgi:5''-3'' exonuclease (including N-terminal domain of PolI)
MPENVFLIVDVSNVAHRAAWGNKELKTSSGRFSGHVFGAVSILQALLRNEFKNQNVTIVFCHDGDSAKDYRLTILPTYKGNREPREFDPVPEVASLFRLWPGIHVCDKFKEGDDAMAYVAHARKGKPCVIFSGDKDLWTLMKLPNCKVFSPNLGRYVEYSDFYKHYRLREFPERIPLAKSLFGDISDNIFGCKGLLKKQVEGLLNSPGVETPEEFYNKLGDTKPDYISDKMWVKLQEAKETVFKNYLVVLPCLDFKRESIVKVTGGFGPLKAALSGWECFSLIRQFN